MTIPKNIMAVKSLKKEYGVGSQKIEVLRDINLTLQIGERIAILGKSGSGKSTLLHILGGLETITSGEVEIDGENTVKMSDNDLSKFRNRTLGFVFQFHYLMLEFSAVENVMMPLLIAGIDDVVARKRASEVLSMVGLSQRLSHEPRRLSGGEQQRVAIARALVMRPKILLTDEMTGNLDTKTGREIHELITRMQRELGLSLISVTHDESLAADYDRQLILKGTHLLLASSFGQK